MAKLPKEVAMVLDRFTDAESARKPLEDVWLECYKLYRMYREELPEEDEGLSNIFVPKILADIESITPRIVLSLFARRPYVVIKPREQGDVERAKLVSKLIQAQFDKQNMFMKAFEWIKQALIYGSSPAQIGWRHERRVGKTRVFAPRIVAGQDMTQLFGPVPREQETVYTDWDDPWFEPIDVWDFYPDPDAKTLDDAGWVIRRQWVSREEMEAAGVYHNIAEAARTASESAGRRPAEERLQAVGRIAGRAGETRTRPIELLHFWRGSKVTTIANRTVVVRDEQEDVYYHGRLPFVHIVDTLVPHEFHGIGVAEAEKGLQEELNSIRNQRRDNVTMALQRMVVVMRNVGIKGEQLRWRPNGVIWIDDTVDPRMAIQVLDVPEVTRSAYEEEDRVHRDMEEVSAVSDFVRGALAETQRTATEISLAAQGGNARVQLKIAVMAMGLKEVARHFLDLNRQFLTEERVVRVIGERGRDEWITVHPGDLQFPYDDLIPAAANVEGWANRLQEREDLLRLIQIAGRAPVFLQMLNWRKIMERVLQTFDFAEVEDFLVPEDQASQLQEQLSQVLLNNVGMATGNAANSIMQEMMAGGTQVQAQPGVGV